MGLVVLGCVLVAATAVGLCWQHGNGRMRPIPARTRDMASIPRSAAVMDDPVPPGVLASLGVDPTAAPVTLVQFSSAFCQPCRATRAVLGAVVAQLPVVRRVEVDAESHLAEVRALGVLRTPTVLVLDRTGRVVRRASGQPRVADVIAAVAPLLAGPGLAP